MATPNFRYLIKICSKCCKFQPNVDKINLKLKHCHNFLNLLFHNFHKIFSVTDSQFEFTGMEYALYYKKLQSYLSTLAYDSKPIQFLNFQSFKLFQLSTFKLE